MTLGYFYAVLISGHMVLSAASSASVDPVGELKSTAAEVSDVLAGTAGMMRREFEGQKDDKVDAASQSLFEEDGKSALDESLFQQDGKEWQMDHVPISTYFSFAEYGQRYREATGVVQRRKEPANALSTAHQKELRFFVRSLLEEAEDFEAKKLLQAKSKSSAARNPGGFHFGSMAKHGVPSWYHGGQAPNNGALKFEYQASIGRDGFEPDPTEPVCEFFGPFKIDYGAHTIYLENWNLMVGTKLERYGMGNLIVGLNHTFREARNGVVFGKSNQLKGSYGAVTGEENFARGRGAVVDGGYQNVARADYGNVNGGQKNNVTTHFAVVEGGYGNSATAPFSAVGGGENNLVDGFVATIMGGRRNEALANLSAIIGGTMNIIPPTAISETVRGGSKGNVPTPEPPKALVIEPGEYSPKKAESSKELNYAALGCASAENCEQEEEEEEQEEDEEDDNPATKRRTIDVEQVHEGGDSRRRTNHDDEHEDMQIKAAP